MRKKSQHVLKILKPWSGKAHSSVRFTQPWKMDELRAEISFWLKSLPKIHKSQEDHHHCVGMIGMPVRSRLSGIASVTKSKMPAYIIILVNPNIMDYSLLVITYSCVRRKPRKTLAEMLLVCN
jgi:hypothetical protein